MECDESVSFIVMEDVFISFEERLANELRVHSTFQHLPLWRCKHITNHFRNLIMPLSNSPDTSRNIWKIP